MIRKGIVWFWGCEIVLAAVLLGGGLGCNPAGTTAGGTPATTKPNKQPDNKVQPDKQPKPDVGRSNPFRDSPVRALKIVSPLQLAA
jgi:hypothetical protein